MERVVGLEPPYHVPVFVLTHHARAPITMDGGTTFYFVTDGIHAALERAKEAAQGRDIRVGGGVATVRQYLGAGLIDELHLAIAPVLLGKLSALIRLPTTSPTFECQLGTVEAFYLGDTTSGKRVSKEQSLNIVSTGPSTRATVCVSASAPAA